MAASRFARALKRDPHDTSARLGLARLRGAQGAWSDVLAALAGHDDEADPNAEVHYWRGLALTELAEAANDDEAARGLADEAVSQLDVAALLAPGVPAVFYDRARAHLVLAQSDLAIADCDVAASLVPEHPDPYFLRGVVRSASAMEALERDDSSAASIAALAVSDFDRSAALGPDDPRPLLSAGDLETDLGQWEAAGEHYSRALRIDSELVEAYVWRGIARAATDDFPGAIEDFDRAIAREPDNVLALTRRGIAHAALVDLAVGEGRAGDVRKEIELGLKDYDAAIDLDPATIEARVQRGVLRWFSATRDDAEAAIPDAEELLKGASADLAIAVDLDASVWDAHYYGGLIHQRLGDLDAAMRDFSEAIKIDDSTADAWTARGLVHEIRGYFDEARADYERVTSLTPTDPEAWVNLGNARLGLNDTEGALKAYGDAMDRDPSVVNAYLGRASVRIAQGELELAVRDLDTAIAFAPTEASIYESRADQLAALDDYDRAIWDYDRAIALAPHLATAHRGRSFARLQLGFGYSERRSAHRAAKAFEQAIVDARRAGELDHEDGWADRYEGYGLRARSGYDYAEEAFERAASKVQSDPPLKIEMLIDRADALQSWGRYLRTPRPTHDAIAAFESIIEDVSDRPDLAAEAQRGMAEALVDADRARDALPFFRTALKGKPKDAQIEVGEATAHLLLGEARRARDGFKRALGHGAKEAGLDRTAMVGLALSLRRLGQHKEAASTLRASLAGTPRLSRYERSRIFEDLHEPDAALADARAAVRATPDLFEPVNQVAWLLTVNEPTARRLAEAVALARKAVRLAEDDSERASGLDTLGWALFCAGQVEEAVGVLDEAVRMDAYDVMLRSHLADARAAAGSPPDPSRGQQHESVMQAVGQGR